MRTLKSLRREAVKSTSFRGHKMKWGSVSIFNSNPTKMDAVCKNCGMVVTINTKPAPNEIDIGGEAVALTCKMPKYRLHTYDVWGNNIDGYQVNDCFRTSTIIEIPDSISDSGIIRKLKQCGFLPVGAKNCKYRIDGEPDYTLYVTYEPECYPVCELRRIKEDD